MKTLEKAITVAVVVLPSIILLCTVAQSLAVPCNSMKQTESVSCSDGYPASTYCANRTTQSQCNGAIGADMVSASLWPRACEGGTASDDCHIIGDNDTLCDCLPKHYCVWDDNEGACTADALVGTYYTQVRSIDFDCTPGGH